LEAGATHRELARSTAAADLNRAALVVDLDLTCCAAGDAAPTLLRYRWEELVSASVVPLVAFGPAWVAVERAALLAAVLPLLVPYMDALRTLRAVMLDRDNGEGHVLTDNLTDRRHPTAARHRSSSAANSLRWAVAPPHAASGRRLHPIR
jgi:hypothetical protein